MFRNVWGCDGPTNTGRWFTKCHKCHQSGCKSCFGGVVRMERCPLFYTKKIKAERHAFQAFALLKNFKTWPVDGGLLDQSNWFIEATLVLSAQLSELEKMRLEEARKGGGRKSKN